MEDGSLQGTTEDGLRVYRGIPYAAPPVGDLRWRPPQPAAKWEGVRAADKFGRACIQTNQAIANLPAPSEDCLYLNVWTPAKRAKDKLPVLVWIHGGGFVAGAPAEKLYHGEWLAKKGVVFVSLAYRLGVFGFLADPELSAESPHHVSGNYGILDMIAGLQWVQQNISAFGGNPTKVTIQGESARAAAVSILCASPLARGLFRAAIAESGGTFGPVRANASFGERTGRCPLVMVCSSSLVSCVSGSAFSCHWRFSAGVDGLSQYLGQTISGPSHPRRGTTREPEPSLQRCIDSVIAHRFRVSLLFAVSSKAFCLYPGQIDYTLYNRVFVKNILKEVQ